MELTQSGSATTLLGSMTAASTSTCQAPAHSCWFSRAEQQQHSLAVKYYGGRPGNQGGSNLHNLDCVVQRQAVRSGLHSWQWGCLRHVRHTVFASLVSVSCLYICLHWCRGMLLDRQGLL